MSYFSPAEIPLKSDYLTFLKLEWVTHSTLTELKQFTEKKKTFQELLITKLGIRQWK